jgi:hypothetical protein
MGSIHLRGVDEVYPPTQAAREFLTRAGQPFPQTPSSLFDVDRTIPSTSHSFPDTPEGLDEAKRIARLYVNDPIGTPYGKGHRSYVRLIEIHRTGEDGPPLATMRRAIWPPPSMPPEGTGASDWLIEYREKRRARVAQARREAGPDLDWLWTPLKFLAIGVLVFAALLLAAWLFSDDGCDGEYVQLPDRTTECFEP